MKKYNYYTDSPVLMFVTYMLWFQEVVNHKSIGRATKACLRYKKKQYK